MPPRTDTDWMWGQALAMVERAERMHRQFFRLAATPRVQPAWEPPVDVFEDADEFVVVVAMPGVAAERVEVIHEPGALVVRGERPLPFAGSGRRVRRLEIPYGVFERRIGVPAGASVRATDLAHGVLVVRLATGVTTMIESNDLIPVPLAADGPVQSAAAVAEGKPRAEGAGRPLPADAVIVLPVRNMVLFPGIVVPLTIGRERSLAAVQEAVRLGAPIGILLQSKPDVDDPHPDDLHWVGTTGAVLRYVAGPDGAHFAITKGQQRFRVLQFLEGWPFLVARVQTIEEAEASTPEVEGRAHTLRNRALEILKLLPQVPEEMVAAFQAVEGAAKLADFIAGMMDITAEEKQKLLETFDLAPGWTSCSTCSRTASRC